MGEINLSYSDLESRLRAAMSRPLPGSGAQHLLAPAGRSRLTPDSIDQSKVRKAAVMALFYPKNEQPQIILTQRVEYEGVHSGQISFPGGKREEEDRDFLATALRETEEEVGISAQEVDVAGAFSQLYIPPSNFLVYPYLGFLKSTPNYTRQVEEVHRIIALDFNHFLNDQYLQQTQIEVRGFSMKVPAFLVEGHIVWGATAMMLAELRAMALNP